MRRGSFLMMVSALAVVASSSVVHAEDKTAKPGAGGAITTDTLQVTGRVARPQVITEVTKITPAQHLTQLRQPLLYRVEKAIDKSPF